MKKLLVVFIVIIAAVIIGYYAFPEKVAEYFINYERSKAGLVKKEIKVDDLKIVYLEGGKGPNVVMLHGYGGDKDNWPRFAAYLTKDYHVVIPDLSGHGESSQLLTTNYDPISQADRLHKLFETLNLKKLHIVGNSMGGLISGTYAVRYPDDIISIGLFDAGGVRSLEKSEVGKIFEKGGNPLQLKGEDDLSRFMGLLFYKSPSVPYPFKKMFIKKSVANKAVNEKILKDIASQMGSLEKNLPKIKAPTLILWGDKDKVLDITSVPVFEKGLKNHKTVIIKDCGHLPMLEKPQETAEAYLVFVKSIKQ
jgi:abhydrolase domain-containing protein 6